MKTVDSPVIARLSHSGSQLASSFSKIYEEAFDVSRAKEKTTKLLSGLSAVNYYSGNFVDILHKLEDAFKNTGFDIQVKLNLQGDFKVIPNSLEEVQRLNAIQAAIVYLNYLASLDKQTPTVEEVKQDIRANLGKLVSLDSRSLHGKEMISTQIKEMGSLSQQWKVKLEASRGAELTMAPKPPSFGKYDFTLFGQRNAPQSTKQADKILKDSPGTPKTGLNH